MINKTLTFLLMLGLYVSIAGSDLIATLHNLQDLKESFVLETTKIEIPGYPGAFNPSIIKWKGRTLMCFRIRDPITASTDQIGFVWLTDEFKLDGQPTVLQRFNENMHRPSLMPSMAQEPRLITQNEELYIVYSNVFQMRNGKMKPRMIMSAVDYDGTSFSIVHPQPILFFGFSDDDKQEKNWVPFVHEDNLLLSYSISPHRVLLPVPLDNACLPYSISQKLLDWDWGTIRGGSPAQMVGGQYLAFFHSLKGLATVQSDQQNMTHYFMGAYTFDAHPPFAINAMSSKPIVGNSFYEGPMYKTWKPLRVVYPGGFVFDDDFIWVSYGRQDFEIWIVKLDRKGLLESLKSVD